VLPFYPAFLAGMNLVLLADDAFTFLVAWEFMSLSSCALVMAHHREAENVRAAYIYLVMASIGTLALLLAFGALAGADGGYGFAQHPRGATVATIAALVFGPQRCSVRARRRVWCRCMSGCRSPHPAAPSHVSALMSGVMTKVAVYGFIRIVFDLLGSPPWWWGMVVLVVGSATAVMGILYAVLQRDLKKLLAYSTVENIGVVFAALGLALAFRQTACRAAAALATTAALFHVLNHAIFKSLLFFGAGAVLNATAERNIEKLGGLIHRMPQTAFAVLVGCVAISRCRPLNGFAFRMAPVPGDPARARAAALGA
jgi:formate hydrogenlyase subunit 3/multisubunit Na+/H+ antiporter MnhD subunit